MAEILLLALGLVLSLASLGLIIKSLREPGLVRQQLADGHREQAAQIRRTFTHRLGWAICLLLLALTCQIAATG